MGLSIYTGPRTRIIIWPQFMGIGSLYKTLPPQALSLCVSLRHKSERTPSSPESQQKQSASDKIRASKDTHEQQYDKSSLKQTFPCYASGCNFKKKKKKQRGKCSGGIKVAPAPPSVYICGCVCSPKLSLFSSSFKSLITGSVRVAPRRHPAAARCQR